MMRLARALIALVTVFVGLFAAASPAALANAPFPPTIYNYAGAIRAAPANDATTERGPPATDAPGTTYDAVDHWSRGSSARSDGDTHRLTYDYDDPAHLVQIVGAAPEGPVQVAATPPSSFPPVHVAANAGTKLLPKVDNAFQFPGAGRSGAGVKNFVGPPNTIARGASPGRVFVTDEQGRVIFDITRDRVKPVVPGRGFVAGDGRKLTPTSEQLGWIDELWGG